MRPPRALALILCLAAPAGAAFVERVSLEPALATVASAPAFQASVMTQVQLAASLTGQPAAAVSLSPLTAAIAVPAPSADPWRPEAARLVAALVSQPKAVAANQAAIRATLGDSAFESLNRSASRLASKAPENPGLQAELAGVRRTLDLADPTAVADMSARLDKLFENSRARVEDAAAPVVAENASGHHRPIVSLARPGEKPAMSPTELEAYVASHQIVTPRGMKKVTFASGDYRAEYEPALKRLGVDVVVIKGPSRAELARFKEEDGYHFKSEYERWVMTTRTLDEHRAALGKSARVRQLNGQLASSEHIPTRLVPLTVEDFDQWYPIYNDEVVGKPGGKRNVEPDFARKLAEKGQLEGRYGLFYYDPADPKRMVGGVIMRAWPERGMFVLGFAAYRPELKDVSPSVRTFAESMELARKLGFKVLSFGQDTNLFGYDYNLGLMANKASFMLTPYPEDEVVLMKVLDGSKFASVKNGQGKTGGYFFFGIKRDGAVAERYLESRDAGHPKEAQELLGSDHYFDDKVVPAKDTVVGWHYKGDDPNPLRTPTGIDIAERPLAALSSPR